MMSEQTEEMRLLKVLEETVEGYRWSTGAKRDWSIEIVLAANGLLAYQSNKTIKEKLSYKDTTSSIEDLSDTKRDDEQVMYNRWFMENKDLRYISFLIKRYNRDRTKKWLTETLLKMIEKEITKKEVK